MSLNRTYSLDSFSSAVESIPPQHFVPFVRLRAGKLSTSLAFSAARDGGREVVSVPKGSIGVENGPTPSSSNNRRKW